jgi:hypothetical protein
VSLAFEKIDLHWKLLELLKSNYSKNWLDQSEALILVRISMLALLYSILVVTLLQPVSDSRTTSDATERNR